MTRTRAWASVLGLLGLLGLFAAASASAVPEESAAPIRVEPTWPPSWPLDPAPITASRWPALPAPLPVAPPATAAAARMIEAIDRVRANLRTTRYQHFLSVDERRGRYLWDCSLMVYWLVGRAAPRAARAVPDGRPSARRFARLIARAPADRERAGWQRVAHIEAVRPGDIFAWETPRGSPSDATGHTGVVLERPRPVPGIRRAYAIRIADSIVGPHQEDSRPEGTEGGFGIGIMTFLTDEQGAATHYGWHGTRTRGYGRSPVLFGRVWR